MENKTLLKLERFCGEEFYPIKSAKWNIYYDEDLDMNNLCLYIDMDKGIKLHEDTEYLEARPNWELNYLELAKNFDKNSLTKGFKAEIPDGYNEEHDGYVTNLYYCEHDETDNNTIEILNVDGNRLYMRVTGEATDVNFYDGSKPANKLVVEAWFEFDAETWRSMS